MKKIQTIKPFFLIPIYLLFILFSFNVGIAQTISRTLEINKGLGLLKNSDFGIISKSDKVIHVFAYDQYLYDKTAGTIAEKQSASFMYGFKSNGNTNGAYQNISFGINERKSWWCYVGFCPFKYKVESSTVWDNSNSLKLFKKAVRARQHYTFEQIPNSGEAQFFALGDGTINVLIKVVLSSGANLSDITSIKIPGISEISGSAAFTPINDYYFGADMSTVQNLKDKGITWNDPNITGDSNNPYEIISKRGMNIARFKLFVEPQYYNLPGNNKNGTPYKYATLLAEGGVKDQIVDAKDKGLKILLDLHFSDTWTDPQQNIIPKSWKINDAVPNAVDLPILANNYLLDVLSKLKDENALPDLIQLGNETNSNMMLSAAYESMTINQIATEIGVNEIDMWSNKYTINWDRMATILNPMITTIKTFNSENNTNIKSIFHIAGAMNAKFWIDSALKPVRDAGGGIGTIIVSKPDFLGISYYPAIEGTTSITDVVDIINTIYNDHSLRSIIVETGYPKTNGYSDSTNNIQGLPLLDNTVDNQKKWLGTLLKSVYESYGGAGVLYWEPFWVGSNNEEYPMIDTIGSTWENMSFFSFELENPTSNNLLETNGGIAAFCEFNIGLSCTQNKVAYQPDTVIKSTLAEKDEQNMSLYPNPTKEGSFNLEFGLEKEGPISIEIFNIAGKKIYNKQVPSFNKGNHKIEFGKSDINLASGVYLLKVVTNELTQTRKLIVE
jgi:arabinogalactan endo-1,4-beta-galactosidase